MARFTYTGTRACGIKDGLRSDGFKMGKDRLSYLWDSSVGADWYVRFPLKQCADLWNLPYTGVIDRPELQSLLLAECDRLQPGAIRNGEEVVGYEQREGRPGVRVQLSSGAVEEADVLVGADGIWSSVRAQMYGEARGKLAKGGTERQGCTYSGYTVFAGETVLPLPGEARALPRCLRAARVRAHLSAGPRRCLRPGMAALPSLAPASLPPPLLIRTRAALRCPARVRVRAPRLLRDGLQGVHRAQALLCHLRRGGRPGAVVSPRGGAAPAPIVAAILPGSQPVSHQRIAPFDRCTSGTARRG
jgi:hypothetical protein